MTLPRCDDLLALRRLANAALTPGAEAYDGLTAVGDGHIEWGDGDEAAMVRSYPEGDVDGSALASWWAAATPSRILTLIEELDAARSGLSGRVSVQHLGEAVHEVECHDGVVLLVDNLAAAAWCRHRQLLVLECDDTTDPTDPRAFSEAQACQLVRWTQDIGPSNVLVACHHGESRSTAAARIVLRAWGWPTGKAAEAVERAVPRGRVVDPNPLILSRGEAAL